ncbi:MAG: hypothetical protein QOF51_3203 [Chloroflexota bacterium]|jgi:ubiquinone/menaquinone biosynthesis C-methylase UbiE|nr:hypothetical protein [Chloroflexota bacterium]
MGSTIVERSLRRLVRPRWTAESERMDEPTVDPDLLAGNLADLRRVNRDLGGTRLTQRAIADLTTDLRPGDELVVLDVATGSADIPAAVAQWAQRRHLRCRCVATDLSPLVLQLARKWETTTPMRGATHVLFAAADGRALPIADGAVDVAMCSLALHHFQKADAVTMLREMGRVARLGIVVNDLIRSWPGYLGAQLFGLTLTQNSLTRHDGPLSVRRAYTRAELRDLMERAELQVTAAHTTLGYRVALAAHPRRQQHAGVLHQTMARARAGA